MRRVKKEALRREVVILVYVRWRRTKKTRGSGGGSWNERGLVRREL